MLFAGLLTVLAMPSRDSVPQMRMRIDSARHEVVVLAGPFRVPPSPPEMDHMMMMDGSDHDMDMDMPLTPVQTFTWPVTGWMHGFKVELLDGDGRVLPQRLMHHLIAVNFSRRQFIYPAVERLMGVGEESDHDVSIPKSIGVPLVPGQEIGVYVMWNNQTGADLPAVYYRLTLRWLPKNLQPRLLAIRGEGIRLKAGHRYRVVGVYDNTTADTLFGAMAHMVGLFAPDDLKRWPTINPADSSYQKDIADLRGKGL